MTRRGSRSRPAPATGPVAASGVCAAELATLDVFAGVPARDLTALAANLVPLRAVPGEVLMRQGERATSFAIITSGRVGVVAL